MEIIEILEQKDEIVIGGMYEYGLPLFYRLLARYTTYPVILHHKVIILKMIL